MGDTLTFLGTATTLLRLGSFTVLTDPNFLHRGQRAYLGKRLWSRRLTHPAMAPDELPSLDAVVLSHLHGDHFDRVARHRLSREQPVLTTPAAARKLDRWGFHARGLEVWRHHTLTRGDESLTVQALPAIHARGPMAALLPPVMGSLLQHRATRPGPTGATTVPPRPRHPGRERTWRCPTKHERSWYRVAAQAGGTMPSQRPTPLAEKWRRQTLPKRKSQRHVELCPV